MAFSLADIQRNTQGPPRIIVYGVPGIGKTTLAASMPSPIFLPIEDGLGQLDVPTFPKPTSFEDVMSAVAALTAGGHEFQTVVIDSLDALEPMVWEKVCRDAGKKSIEDFGYGKGYVAAAAEWRKLRDALDALRDSGVMVCVIAHSIVAHVEPPDNDPYDRYQMRLHKTAEAIWCDWADAVLFANYVVRTVTTSGDKKRGVGKGERLIHANERPAYRAKNRYRMPDELPMEWAALSAFLPTPPTE